MALLFIPNRFSEPGAPSEVVSDGFTLLALNEKGGLIRLDKNFPNNPEAQSGLVVYAARMRDPLSFKVIRQATLEDRTRKFRRPEHLDQITYECCDSPCKYLSIYDDGSGAFFNLDISAIDAGTMREGNLYYYFLCEKCLVTHTIPIEE